MADEFQRLLGDARERMESEDYTGALRISDRLILCYGNRPFPWIQRARILLAMDAYQEAMSSIRQATRVRPGAPDAAVHLARLLSRFHMHREVDALHAAMDDRQRAHLPLLHAFAEIYTYRNCLDRALECIGAALAVGGNQLLTLFMRGRIRVFQGDFVAAIDDFEHCLDIDPSASGPHWYLSRIDGSRDRSAQLRQMIASGSVDRVELPAIWFALHHYQHRNGERGRSRSLAEACRLQRELVEYPEGDANALFGAIKQWSLRQVARPAVVEMPTPVFIVGMHRSGTTLLEYSLAKSGGVHPCGELYDFPASLRELADHDAAAPLDQVILSRAARIDLDLLGERYLAAAGYLSGGARIFSDKLPSNYQNIGFILSSLPSAKVVHVSRSPLDTCFSNLRELFSGHTNPFSYDPAEMARHYLRYADLMAHWKTLYGDRILNITYEDLVADTKRTIHNVREFCGMEQQPSADSTSEPAAVSTASAFNVRGKISSRQAPEWLGYEDWLAPARSILQE